MKETIRRKFNEARKDKNELSRKTYESVIAKITIAEKSGKYELPLSNEIIVSLIQKEVKELEETLACYNEPNEASAKILLQIAELQQYLPKALTLDEVRHIILEIIESGETNKGKIIKATVSKVGNRFERSKIPGLVEIALMGQL